MGPLSSTWSFLPLTGTQRLTFIVRLKRLSGYQGPNALWPRYTVWWNCHRLTAVATMNPSPLTSSYLPSPSLHADRFVCKSLTFTRVAGLCASTFLGGVWFGLVGLICTATATYPAHPSSLACGGALRKGLRKASELFPQSPLVSRSKIGRRVWLFRYANIGGLASCYAKRLWILKTPHKPFVFRSGVIFGWNEKWTLIPRRLQILSIQQPCGKVPAGKIYSARPKQRLLTAVTDTTRHVILLPCLQLPSCSLVPLFFLLSFFLGSQWDPGKKVWIHHLHGGGAQ